MSDPSEPFVGAQRFFERQPPPEYLEEWLERLAQPEQLIELDLLSLVIFRLQQEYFAVQTGCLVEVTLPQPVHAIPHCSNEIIQGLVNIRGQLRVCFSAHGLLGVSLPAQSQQIHGGHVACDAHSGSLERILIMHERSEQWVFPVEEVLGVHAIPRGALRSVPSTFGKAGAFSQSVLNWESHTVGYLDAALLFSALRSACK